MLQDALDSTSGELRSYSREKSSASIDYSTAKILIRKGEIFQLTYVYGDILQIIGTGVIWLSANKQIFLY